VLRRLLLAVVIIAVFGAFAAGECFDAWLHPQVIVNEVVAPDSDTTPNFGEDWEPSGPQTFPQFHQDAQTTI
jgi:hypothetical protein